MLSLDREHRLVTGLGHPVMGTKGKITIPPGKLEISEQGTSKSTENLSRPSRSSNFLMMTCRRSRRMDCFFRKRHCEQNPQIQVGHIEESNVNSIGEMVKMIQGMRNYESTQN